VHLRFVGFIDFKGNDSFLGLCGSKTGEVTGQWRRAHNAALRDLYFSPNLIQVIKSRRMRWPGHVALWEKKRGEYRIFVGKPEGKIQFLRLRRRWEDDSKVDGQEVGWGTWNGFVMLRRGAGGGLL